jgi:hypothetical protein
LLWGALDDKDYKERTRHLALKKRPKMGWTMATKKATKKEPAYLSVPYYSPEYVAFQKEIKKLRDLI